MQQKKKKKNPFSKVIHYTEVIGTAKLCAGLRLLTGLLPLNITSLLVTYDSISDEK